jgi:hypothetical protein
MKTKILLLFTGLVLLSSCAVISEVVEGDTDVSEEYSYKALENNGLIILPTVAEPQIEGYRRYLGILLQKEAENSNLNYSSYINTFDVIKDNQMLPDHNSMIDRYLIDGTFDREYLNELSSKIGYNYVIFTSLSKAQDTPGNKESLGVSVTSYIWGAKENGVVLKAEASASATAGAFSYVSETEQQMIEKVSSSIFDFIRSN